ncbi:MAG: universal stress protein [Armatimonadota bacterium]|nr:universal stress protein [Armatimonadota bacterium]MDR7402177.1 universal stress protein [Armatimonadota bacterium]MDR7404627.1 universal stress protein [Armatimonadota bacterium]MDR7436934.1 universal stress protein [Armatimonadota bacterium]MDR7472292.1 universal stress protein [Armatimonadota bacterium]
MERVRRVLVATDLSDTAPVLLAQAVGLAERWRAELVVVHVFDPEEYERLLGDTGMPVDEYVDHLRAEMRDALAEAGIGDTDVSVRLEVIEDRDVAGAIVSAANRLGADLVVVGARPRRGLPALRPGVADAVLRRAGRPVLVVPHTSLRVGPQVLAAAS